MEFSKYGPAPQEVADELRKEYSGQVAEEED
jgi:hypothetical protein